MTERHDIAPLALMVARVTNVLERETAQIARGDLGGLAAAITAKSRLLVDLNRALREDGLGGGDARLAAQIRDLRNALDANLSIIAANVEASRTFVSLVGEAARTALSDGTYGKPGRTGS